MAARVQLPSPSYGACRETAHHGREQRPGETQLDLARTQLGSCAEILARHGHEVRWGRSATCPFHPDDTPSLSVFTGRDGRSRFRCHGCGAHGDGIDLEAALSGRTVRDLIAEYGR